MSVKAMITNGKKENNVSLRKNFLRAGGCIILEADEYPGPARPRKKLWMQGGCCVIGAPSGESHGWVHAQRGPLSLWSQISLNQSCSNLILHENHLEGLQNQRLFF